MFSKNIKFHRGFTLVELMVVIAIVGIMSSIVFVSWQKTKGGSYLRDAQREVASAIKTAQSYALQGRVNNGEVPCGYGVNILSVNSYNLISRVGCEATPSYENLSPSQIFYLKNGINFDSSDVNKRVIFGVPFGNTITSVSTMTSLTLRYGTTASKTITISGGSVVED